MSLDNVEFHKEFDPEKTIKFVVPNATVVVDGKTESVYLGGVCSAVDFNTQMAALRKSRFPMIGADNDPRPSDEKRRELCDYIIYGFSRYVLKTTNAEKNPSVKSFENFLLKLDEPMLLNIFERFNRVDNFRHILKIEDGVELGNGSLNT